MNNIDDLVSSLGINIPGNSSRPVSTANYAIQQEPAHQEEEITEEVQVPETPQVTLDDSEYDDILSSIGYDDSNGEEMEDGVGESWEEEEEEVTNDGLLHQIGMSPASTAADLDEEEDAEWDERIGSGEITEVQPNATQREQIPENSPTLTIDDSTSRFSGTEWYREIQKQNVILAGLGGIGSWCAFQLARMNPNTLFLFDDDIVESANMSGQLYSSTNIGQYKADAINSIIYSYTSMGNAYSIREKFTSASEAGPIMMCGFDNMKARKTFFSSWKGYVDSASEEMKRKCLFIGGRLSIDTLQVFCIRGDDNYNIHRYNNEFLFSDEEADETVCSMKQTTYLACMIGSFMVNLFTNFTASLLDPVMPYDVPFFTEYDTQNMIFKTER